jgi:hypothetical protein
MDGVWLARARWRRRGAWMWPTFVTLTVLDGVIGSRLPPTGEGWNGVGAGLVCCFINLFVIAVLAPIVGWLLRRIRGDLPPVVAKDYAGTTMIVAVTAVLLVVGLIHHATVRRDRAAMADAISRAQAYIGDRAPAEFRGHLAVVDTLTIEAGRVYRLCVPSSRRPREYCVIVRTGLPFARSVSFDGYEPNALFGVGTG